MVSSIFMTPLCKVMSTFIRMFNLLAVDSMKQTSELQVVTKCACQYGIHNLFF